MCSPPFIVNLLLIAAALLSQVTFASPSANLAPRNSSSSITQLGILSLDNTEPLATFDYSTTSPDSQNWIGIFSAGVDPATQDSRAYNYAPQANGSVMVDVSELGPGNYTAYFFNTGYKQLAEPVDVQLSSLSTISPTLDGSCGKDNPRGNFSCKGTDYGGCCSNTGWCGDEASNCGPGCQEEFSRIGTCFSSRAPITLGALSLDNTKPFATFDYSTTSPGSQNVICIYSAAHPPGSISCPAGSPAPQANGSVMVDVSELVPGNYKAYFLTAAYEPLAEPVDVILPLGTSPGTSSTSSLSTTTSSTITASLPTKSPTMEPELGPIFAQIERNFQIDYTNPPTSDAEKHWQPTCLTHWGDCNNVAFYAHEFMTYDPRGVNVTAYYTRWEDQAVFNTDSDTTQQFTVTNSTSSTESTTKGWKIGAELSGSFGKDGGSGGLKISAEYSDTTTNATTTTTEVSFQMTCKPLHECRIETWTFHVKLDAYCRSSAMVDCGAPGWVKQNPFDICESPSSDCSQFDDYLTRNCERIPPEFVEGGGEAWMTKFDTFPAG